MNIDMHVHTEFSCDSEAKMEKYMEIANIKKVDVLCFTDHVDYNKNDYGYQYYNPEQYFIGVENVKKKCCGNCKILSGIEFSEPHLYRSQFEDLKKYPYDYVIGSIHWIGDMFPCKEVREKYRAKEFYELYWKEVLKAVQTDGFDGLGHIDFPKRYYGEVVYEKEMIQQIFESMLKKGVVLEINTSSIRKGIDKTMPDIELLQLYKDCGGKYVTTGSDAHNEVDLALDLSMADELISKTGLKKVYFVNREMIRVEV